MKNLNLSQILLLPFAGLYALAIAFRNFLYEKRYYRAIQFDVPTISVGNLNTGGTGKTPHVAYLIELLKENYSIGVLSRGYRRKTSGYLEVQTASTAYEVGDEALLCKWKYPDVKVAVAESRTAGIPQLVNDAENNFVVLLDDAFQHRALRPGLSILLTPYYDLYVDDFLLPVGNLREFKSGAKRADIIIVSHAPKDLNPSEKQSIREKLQLQAYQLLFFSYLQYLPSYQVFEGANAVFTPPSSSTILLVSGIANNSALKSELEKRFAKVYERSFSDHHPYTDTDIESIINSFKELEDNEKYLITTEKDLPRLFPFAQSFNKAQIKVLCLPIKVNFAAEEKQGFDKAIHFFVEKSLENYLEE